MMPNSDAMLIMPCDADSIKIACAQNPCLLLNLARRRHRAALGPAADAVLQLSGTLTQTWAAGSHSVSPSLAYLAATRHAERP